MKYTLERSKVLFRSEYESVYELWNGKICVIPEYQLSRMLHGYVIFSSRVENYMMGYGYSSAPLEIVDLIDEIGVPRKAVLCQQDEIGSVIKLFRDEINNVKTKSI